MCNVPCYLNLRPDEEGIKTNIPCLSILHMYLNLRPDEEGMRESLRGSATTEVICPERSFRAKRENLAGIASAPPRNDTACRIAALPLVATQKLKPVLGYNPTERLDVVAT